MPSIWALTIEYINFAGDTISVYMPVFRSEAECVWWSDHLWQLLHELNGAKELLSSGCGRPA